MNSIITIILKIIYLLVGIILLICGIYGICLINAIRKYFKGDENDREIHDQT